MEIRTLRYFLEIAREQNITAASYNLHISQPALSHQMHELEEELGITLFTRTNRKTVLTEEGRHFKIQAEQIIQLIEKTEAEYKQGEKDIYGEIHIGAGETTAMEYIGNAAKRVHDLHPGVRFNVFSGIADDVVDRMDKGLIDFALFFRPIDTTKLDYIEFPIKHKMGIIVRKDSPLAEKEFVTAKDLENVPLIINSRRATSHESISKQYGIPTDKLNVVASGNLTYNKLMLVRSGLGVVIGSGSNSYQINAFAKFVPFEPTIESSMIFAWRKNSNFSKACLVFLDEVKKEIESLSEGYI